MSAAAVRLIDLGLFRIGGEKYAELDHHYGATTLRKSDVKLVRGGVAFDYIAKEGKRRTITVTDHGVSSTVRALIRSGSDLDPLFVFADGDAWRPLHSHQVSNYIATRAGGHYTAKEFRTWNATVLMALLLADADPAPTERGRKSAINAAVRGVADWLGDTPTVARSSYIDPRIISRYYRTAGWRRSRGCPPCSRPTPRPRPPSPRCWRPRPPPPTRAPPTAEDQGQHPGFSERSRGFASTARPASRPGRGRPGRSSRGTPSDRCRDRPPS